MNTKKSDSNNSNPNYKFIIRSILVIISFGIVLYFCLSNYQYFLDFIGKVISILQPIIYGIIFSYLMTPIYNRIYRLFDNLFKKKLSEEQSKKWSKTLAITLSMIILILIILLIIMLIIPQLIASITGFIERAPQYLRTLSEELQNIISFINIRLPNTYQNYLENYASNFIQYLSNNLLPSMSMIINNFSTYVINLARSIFNFVIGLIVTIYCLDKKDLFSLQFKKLLFAYAPKNIAYNIIERTREANKIFLGFLVGKIIDSFIIGIICFFGLVILNIPYPLLISVIIGITNIIPFFGPFLGAVPCFLIILLEDPIKALYFLIFIFLLQQFDGNILGPKILGDRTGVSSFWVLFSILLFGGLFGIVGMIIAVPLFVVIYNLITELINIRLKKKGLPIKAYYYEKPIDLVEDKNKNTIED